MRIIGGKYKRRRFDVPKSFNARPTTDFAKENLFNVLTHLVDFEDAIALDLFAGTGSISLELVSRGCARVVAVEQRREHASFIRSVARELKEDTLRVLQTDVFRYLRHDQTLPEFDFVFADPPYKLTEIANLPDLILRSGRLKPNALVVVEHPQNYQFDHHPHFLQHREYGSVNFSFFTAEVEETQGEETV
ncbi:MAG: 16S rRNA (guanine(966)-N(2))-methyltransferase RsmD [Porphyromonadaceae bacterium]|nr:16S rRNA (guanine(966)-N(2))-methyltransferase RsmD [Porphyromonadaceae bacterium]